MFQPNANFNVIPLVNNGTAVLVRNDNPAQNIRKQVTCSTCQKVGHNKRSHSSCNLCTAITHNTAEHLTYIQKDHEIFDIALQCNDICEFKHILITQYTPFTLTELSKIHGSPIGIRFEQTITRLISYYYCMTREEYPPVDTLYAEAEAFGNSPILTHMYRTDNWHTLFVNNRYQTELIEQHSHERALLYETSGKRDRHTAFIRTKTLENENPVTMETNIECPLCYDSFATKTLLVTECGHHYCKGCFETYMMTTPLEKMPNCAMCRTSLTHITSFAL